MDRIAVIIPAFNEAQNLPNLIAEVKAVGNGLNLPLFPIIINDHSTDNTLSVAAALGCDVLDLPINVGIGGAVQTGLKYALQRGFDLAVQVDGDGQHPPEEIPDLVKAMKDSGADLVIGSRFIKEGGFKSTFSRRTGIQYFSSLIKLFSGQKITDCTSGFRLFNRRAIELAAEYYPDQYPEPESIVWFAGNGLKISEVPVGMRPRQAGRSSIRSTGSIYYMAKVTLAILALFVKLKIWNRSNRSVSS